MSAPATPPGSATSTPTSRAAGRAGLVTAEAIFGAVLFVLAFAVFFYLVRVVFHAHSRTFDTWAIDQTNRLRLAQPWTETAMLVVTFFGSVKFFVPASLLLPLLLYRRGLGRYAVELLLSMGGGLVLNELLKFYFQRARPPEALFHQMGYSFPSGHAMMSMAYYGCLAWLVVQHSHRWGVAALLVSFALLIGFSRVYFHVHYATDVVAGFCGGVAWLVLLRAGIQLFWKKKKVAEEALT